MAMNLMIVMFVLWKPLWLLGLIPRVALLRSLGILAMQAWALPLVWTVPL